MFRKTEDRRLNGNSVIDALSDLFILRGVPAYIRSDNGSEFVAQSVRDWIATVPDIGVVRRSDPIHRFNRVQRDPVHIDIGVLTAKRYCWKT